jgi:hypothetical protein
MDDLTLETAMPIHHLKPESELLQATIEVFEAGQDVVVSRIELLRAEVRDDVEELGWSTALIAAGVGVFALGYLSLFAASVWGLGQLWHPVGALAAAGLLHVVFGLMFGVWATRRFNAQKLFTTKEA